ncbi:hypothetical protein GAYE_SCF46G5810 [Galdieria yellowstonensis]|uniref:DNA topoisomerase 2 n=1 Tax=Galdieria yellowstonensis TaxID=3028027 RepID=A0AAV9IKC1_9RHOD|nr:hypothetical protein GAYE_SCF46G5810 [Galdieria yellowstonensis]
MNCGGTWSHPKMSASRTPSALSTGFIYSFSKVTRTLSVFHNSKSCFSYPRHSEGLCVKPRLLKVHFLAKRCFSRKRKSQTDTKAVLNESTTLQSKESLQEYGASQISVLQGLEPVRKRPGMYIGSTGIQGLHQLVFELVDNSVDESIAGFCDKVTVVLHADKSVSVLDNGRGIPVDTHSGSGKSALETVLTVLHAGGKFGSGGYHVSGGLHGVGLSVVNALSERLYVGVIRNKHLYEQQFQRGTPLGPMQVSEITSDELMKKEGLQEYDTSFLQQTSGTKVRFYPDPVIFGETLEMDASFLAKRFDELAYLNAGLQILLYREMPQGEYEESWENESQRKKQQIQPQVFIHQGGIREFVQFLSKDKQPMHDTIYIHRRIKQIEMEVALQWNKEQYSEIILGFANSIRNLDGGVHVEGFKSGLTKCFHQMAKKSSKGANLSWNGELIREGLVGIVAVKVPEPEFQGQTKTKLGNPVVRGLVEQVIIEEVGDFLQTNPDVFQSLLEKVNAAVRAAEAAKRARELVRRKSALESAALPGKLADCATRNPEEAEIFIVEGDSAGGSAKQGRDRRFQAILPLRGKILNVEKSNDVKIYKNAEIHALITALGAGVSDAHFKLELLRYHRIIIMTDADVDGAHIRTLLLTFFYRYQRPLIEHGHLYIACPPLFKFERGKTCKYFFDQASLDRFLEEEVASNAKYTIQRFKGLGEMMPLELWNTTMNPQTRCLKQVTLTDAAESNNLFTMLLGDKVDRRKTFLNEHARSLSWDQLDI